MKAPDHACSFCSTVPLSIVDVCQGLYKYVSIALVLGNIMMQTSDDGSVVTFGPSVCLQLICNGSDLFTPRNVHNVLKNLLRNCGLFSASRNAGILYCMTQWAKKIDAACGAVVFDYRIARVSFVYQSPMTTMNWFPVAVASGPKMSIATNALACWRVTDAGGPSSWRQLGIWRIHSSRGLLCTHRWRYLAHRAPSYSVVHAKLIGVSRQFKIICPVEEEGSRQVWEHGL